MPVRPDTATRTHRRTRHALLTALAHLVISHAASSQDFAKYSEQAITEYLQEHADIQQKVRVPMRDGIGLSSDVYLPKDTAEPLGTVFIKTPDNFTPLSGWSQRWASHPEPSSS